MNLHSAIETLRTVLCDPAGKCCIEGSDGDRRQVDTALAALASLKGEAEPVAWIGTAARRDLASKGHAVVYAQTNPAADDNERPLIYGDTTPPAPQAGLSAWVSEMNTSAATEYWVCVGWGRNFGEYMTVRMSHMRNRSELEVAEWNHLFGKGTKPCIADPKFRDPEQVSSTPSPAPQGGGEAEMPGVCAFCEGTGRTESEEGHIFLCPQKCPDEASLLRSFADRVIQAEPWLHKGNRFTKWAKDLAADMKEAADRLATPPAQQPGEVVTDEMVDRAIEGYWKSATSDGARPGISTAWMRDALTAALAPKEKGNG